MGRTKASVGGVLPDEGWRNRNSPLRDLRMKRNQAKWIMSPSFLFLHLQPWYLNTNSYNI